MHCNICNHEKRYEIEQALLLRDFGDTEVTLRDIAAEFNVDLKDLQVHALMHIPLAGIVEESAKDAHTSITGEIKRKEADVLRTLMDDQLITFRNLGSKLNSIIAQHTTEKPTFGQLTKSAIDLYLGCGSSIRDSADKLMKMNLLVNGEKNEGLSSLAKLAEVLKDSAPKS